jgi:CRISPR type IV-associated protein Csf1
MEQNNMSDMNTEILITLLQRSAKPLDNEPQYENEGLCCFCGNRKRGVLAERYLPKTFSRFQDLELTGEIICAKCLPVYKDHRFRNRHWVASTAGVRFLQKPEIHEILRNPPCPPWALYITESHKKHGWIRGIYWITHNTSQFRVIHEDSLVSGTSAQFISLLDICAALRSLKIPKKALAKALQPLYLNRVMDAGIWDKYVETLPYVGTALHHVCLYITD